MKNSLMPTQSAPVSRTTINNSQTNSGVTASGIACTICKAGCSALPFPADIACKAACNATVC